MPVDATRRAVSPRGRDVELRALDWGGDGPLALLHHANGFCAATWAPLARELRGSHRVIAIDARGHGGSSAPAAFEAYDWQEFIADWIAVSEALVSERGEPIALAVGNSFGGTLAACAAALRPGLFRRVALLDPVIRPSAELLASHGLAPPGGFSEGPNPIAARARERRSIWPSREAAGSSWRDKDMFRSWEPRAFELYLEHGLRDRGDGQVELCCAPATEAAVFEHSGSSTTRRGCARLRWWSLRAGASFRGRSSSRSSKRFRTAVWSTPAPGTCCRWRIQKGWRSS